MGDLPRARAQPFQSFSPSPTTAPSPPPPPRRSLLLVVLSRLYEQRMFDIAHPERKYVHNIREKGAIFSRSVCFWCALPTTKATALSETVG